MKHYHTLEPEYFNKDLVIKIPLYEPGVAITQSNFMTLYHCVMCGVPVSDTCTHMRFHKERNDDDHLEKVEYMEDEATHENWGQ